MRPSDGWAVTYEATTPSWASFSGMQGKRVLYQRMIALCDGSYAAFRLEYSTVDMAKMDPVVERLVRTLKAVGRGLLTTPRTRSRPGLSRRRGRGA